MSQDMAIADAGLAADRLDDPELIGAADPGGMLRQVASSAAQVRSTLMACAAPGLQAAVGPDRPRAIVVAGMGGSGIAGDVLAAVCGPGSPVQVVTTHDCQLPGWVGTSDLVIAVSCSGSTEETLAVAREAAHRGCRLACVGGADSPLADIAVQARAPFVPVMSAGMPRSTLWGLSIPLIVIAGQFGLARAGEDVYEATAAALERVSYQCRPVSESFINPGKALALELFGHLPLIWGSSPLAGVAAKRFACQLNENAKYPAMAGELPEASHNQVVVFDGPFARDGTGLEAAPDSPLRLVMIADSREHPQVTRQREVSAELASARGVAVSELPMEGDHPLERLASIVQLIDYATVYLGIAAGVDPTPVAIVGDLKERIAEGCGGMDGPGR